MNSVYRIVWNAAKGQWVAASELAKGRKKSSKLKPSAIALAWALSAPAAVCATATDLVANVNTIEWNHADERSVIPHQRIDTGLVDRFDKPIFETTESNGSGGTLVSPGTAKDLEIKRPLPLASRHTDVDRSDEAYAESDQDGRTDGSPRAIPSQRISTQALSDFAVVNGANDGSESAVAGGARSIAIGALAVTEGNESIAIGSESKATNYDRAIALGTQAQSNSSDAIAIGTQSMSEGTGAIAIGHLAHVAASASKAIVLGTEATAMMERSIAVGNLSKTYSKGDIAIGTTALAHGETTGTAIHPAISIGADSTAEGGNSIALGTVAKATGNRSIALGAGATVAAAYSMAIGRLTSVDESATSSVALGNFSVATRSNTISVGATGQERQITNVKGGEVDTDAVNVGQLKASANSMATALGGGAMTDGNGLLSMPIYTVGGALVAGVEAAITALDSHIESNTSNLAALSDMAVTYTDSTKTAIDVGNAQITNVGDATGDKDAVNLSQLKATGLFDTDGVALNAVTYTNIDKNEIKLAGAEGTRISNLADGIEDDDAVNLRQLKSIGLLDADGNALNAVTYTDSTRTAIDVGYAQITNVGDAKDDKDAVNLSQLKATGLFDTDGVALNAVTYTNIDKNEIKLAGAEGTRISNLADGVEDDDAVNLRQLKSVGLISDDGEALRAVTYRDSDKSEVVFGGASGTRLSNVTAGLIAPNSMEAINGGQLYDVKVLIDGLDERVTIVEDKLEALPPMPPVSEVSLPAVAGPITDNGGMVIGNVGDGKAPSDAATVGQMTEQMEDAIATARSYTDTEIKGVEFKLDQFQERIDSRLRQQDKRISSVGAMSAAYAQMALSTQGTNTPNRVGVGVGTQGGRKAIAVGYSRSVAPNINLTFGGSASANEASAGAGLGVGW
ncbi:MULTISPECIES: ESPR-type extended signal peptide-containing protein [Dyella]|uniref:Adhesin n=2 Tax=Dyella TaxID=231454 RepID=A0A4R0YV03_9GAMM|nr:MULTISPECIES: ESPR-type extended signal peptide-containing protein [Dyella]TBR39260.1 hypothetical protein EYV96_03270 [Dyella terrae]TCI13152.1 hypothetical protein EZM97_07595 [Dyella soli]